MEADAFSCLWYICPECGTENTVQMIDNPFFYTGFKCVACKAIWTSDLLHRKYFDGNPVPPKDKLFAGAVEWYCECGRKNVIIPQITKVEDDLLDKSQGLRRHIEQISSPEYGLCEDCYAEYKLNYPLPESVERYLREQGEV